MKHVSPWILHGASVGALRSNVSGKGILEMWITRLLGALHESRRRQAFRAISDNSHLLATPEQIASVMKTAHRTTAMPADNKQTSATGSWASVMMTRSAAITVAALAVFLLHVIFAATLLDSKTSSAGHTPPTVHTD